MVLSPREALLEILRRNMEEGDEGSALAVRVEKGEEERLVVEGKEVVFYTPEEPGSGRDNASLIRFLSRGLKIPTSKMDIIYGKRENLKKVFFADVSPEELARRLIRLVQPI
ncbi:MAG: DUF167 family protein [Desulfurococcaceae archaeon]